jgi:N-acetylated-alpha-linked acidic dipeptidase
VAGSHTLEKFINGVARDIDDPEAKVTVWKRLQAHRLADGPAADRQEARSRGDLRIGALGSGSDYTAFLDHLGIASVNLGFGGEDEGGIYHSIYDDFYWYTHFSDTDFVYGRALAQTAGTSVMRLADADLLPLDFNNFTDTLRRYIDEVRKLAADKREQAVELNRQLDDGVFSQVDDPRHHRTVPARETVPPFLNFAPLENGFAALERTAKAYDEALARASENGGEALARASVREVNVRLIAIERAMTLKEGLPNRDWFKHQIYAPGLYTGYGVKTLPAVRESIEQKNWKLAEEEIMRVGKVLENTGEAIQGATTELVRAAR